MARQRPKDNYNKYYRGANWLRQRNKARVRDSYVCLGCGVREEDCKRELSVHHITPFRLFGISRYKEANKLFNLISFCAHCHGIFEAFPPHQVRKLFPIHILNQKNRMISYRRAFAIFEENRKEFAIYLDAQKGERL